ncbi:MAG: hypothetical protein Q8K45_11760 [Rubrivivax sp.]|nr:hypothetical protein [Rubrivivax sp.]
MRAAPPVSVRCNGGTVWKLVQAGLFALAAGVAAAWGLAHLGMSMAWALGPCAAAAALAWWLSAGRDVALAWDGQRWTADDVPGRLEVMIDLGGWLLLRLRPGAGGRHRWVAVAAREAGPALHGLRAAAFSRPAESAPGDGRLPRVAD